MEDFNITKDHPQASDLCSRSVVQKGNRCLTHKMRGSGARTITTKNVTWTRWHERSHIGRPANTAHQLLHVHINVERMLSCFSGIIALRVHPFKKGHCVKHTILHQACPPGGGITLAVSGSSSFWETFRNAHGKLFYASF